MSVDSLQLRGATADDAPAMALVQLTGWRTAYRGIFPADVLDRATIEDATAKWRQRLATAGGAAFVVLAAGQVVAIAAGGPPAKAPRLAHPVELYSLYLLPDWRRRGIGRGLLATTFSAFRARGAETAYLWCLAGNEGGRSFFARLGGREGETAMRPSVGGLLRESVAVAWSSETMRTAASAAAAASRPADVGT